MSPSPPSLHPSQLNQNLENICPKDAPFLVIYGGGDSIRPASSLLSLRISPPLSSSSSSSSSSFFFPSPPSSSSPVLPPPLLSLLNQVKKDIKKTHNFWSSLPAFDFTRLPPLPPSSPPPSPFEISLSLCVFQLPSPPLPHSLFFQGWLFDGELEEGRMGISRYPLVGLYDPSSSFVSPSPLSSSPSCLPSFCPFDGLSPMDQHVHQTQELLNLDGIEILLNDWNFGGEMAKISIKSTEKRSNSSEKKSGGEGEERGEGSGFGVCVDLDRRRIHVCVLFVCVEGVVGGVEGVVRREGVRGRVGEVVEWLGGMEKLGLCVG